MSDEKFERLRNELEFENLVSALNLARDDTARDQLKRGIREYYEAHGQLKALRVALAERGIEL